MRVTLAGIRLAHHALPGRLRCLDRRCRLARPGPQALADELDGRLVQLLGAFQRDFERLGGFSDVARASLGGLYVSGLDAAPHLVGHDLPLDPEAVNLAVGEVCLLVGVDHLI